MKFLDIARRRNGKVSASFREKAYKFGDVIGIECVQVRKRFLLVAGKLSSGKTRYLTKLCDNAANIWSDQLRPYAHTRNLTAMASRDDRPAFNVRSSDIGWSFPAPVFILANASQAEWLELSHVAAWWDSQDKNAEMPYKKLKAHEKRNAIVQYLRETRAVLFIDDLDKVTPKKIQFFKDMLTVASKVVMTASALNQIPQGLRMIITNNDESFQHVELTTDASFDATHYVMLLVIMISVMSGQWAVAALGSALYGFANKGKFATKF
jgi:hypothetical protein